MNQRSRLETEYHRCIDSHRSELRILSRKQQLDHRECQRKGFLSPFIPFTLIDSLTHRDHSSSSVPNNKQIVWISESTVDPSNLALPLDKKPLANADVMIMTGVSIPIEESIFSNPIHSQSIETNPNIIPKLKDAASLICESFFHSSFSLLLITFTAY